MMTKMAAAGEVTYLTLALYALLILLATIAGDRLGYLANEIRWRACKLWHTQVKWRLGR